MRRAQPFESGRQVDALQGEFGCAEAGKAAWGGQHLVALQAD